MAALDPLSSLADLQAQLSRALLAGHAGLRVALLEDDEVDAEFITRQLAKVWPSDVDVRCFGQLADLEAGLADHRPDIVFCDLSVPDANGIDLAEHVVNLARPIPVVVLTGAEDPSFAVLALEVGAQDYLSKGAFDVDLLARTLRHSLARSRSDEVLRRTASELKATNTELEEYIGIMAHEFRAPIRTGRLFADRLIAAQRSGRDGGPMASALEASLAHMEGMVERLLLLATLREGRPQPTLELLSAAVDRVAVELEADIDAAEGRFTVEADGPVLIDRDLFRDLLRHLAENSIKYRSPDRPLQVSFRTETVGSTTVVTVRDNGIGIAPHYQDRVFRLFERLNPDTDPGAADGQGGHGFGLACCRRIVELHRGTIAVATPADEMGLESRIELPAVPGTMWPQLGWPAGSAGPASADN